MRWEYFIHLHLSLLNRVIISHVDEILAIWKTLEMHISVDISNLQMMKLPLHLCSKTVNYKFAYVSFVSFLPIITQNHKVQGQSHMSNIHTSLWLLVTKMRKKMWWHINCHNSLHWIYDQIIVLKMQFVKLPEDIISCLIICIW